MTGQEEYPRFISNRPCGNDKYEGKSQELSETLGQYFCRFTDYLTAEHVAHRILDYTAFLVPIVTGKLAVILKAQQNRNLVASGGGNQIIKPTKIYSR